MLLDWSRRHLTSNRKIQSRNIVLPARQNSWLLDRLESASLISRILRKMKLSEISTIDSIGNNRADTITAGSLVVKQLMEKLEFDGVTVSTHGLREGVLSDYLQSFRKDNTFSSSPSQQLDQKDFENQAKECCKPWIIPECTNSRIAPLLSSGLLKKEEYEILTHALKQIKNLPQLTNLNNLFSAIMDEDKAGLNHRDQLILALSIIYAKKSKVASWLF
jgi:exopolyphosphatase / guanosine-5'-triphosphate,3'-diphosphate pyrophosphatase